jgi:tetraacyldisaccharide 4'-kinase
VAVCEKRVEGIRQLLPDHDLVILDDAYQHRAVEAGLSILLFDYNRINEPHLLLPAGNMREPFSGRWRAQIIIVSKCPARLTEDEKTTLAYKIEPLPYQPLFFTTIAYQPLEDLQGYNAGVTIDSDTTVFLLTGIASAAPLVRHLGTLTSHIIHHNYADHHPFTLKNITKLAAEFEVCKAQKKLIITTEKDAQRLEGSWFTAASPASAPLPVLVIPVRVEFLDDSGQQFNQLITNYVREHSTHNQLY